MSKVMLVDDEAVITMQLEKRLPSMGYDVVGTASSGEESILMARDLKPSLILMDIVMPGRLDGIDAAEIISKELDIPIIFLTAYTDDEFIERAKNVEPYGYIIKPFNEREIRPNIEIAIYKKELEQRQKQAVERIRKLSGIVEQSPCMIMVTDIKGNIKYVNPRFTQFTGYTSEEVIEKNLRFLKSGEIPPEVYKELWDTIMSGREWRGEFCNKKKNGELYWEYAFISPIKDVEGVINHFVAVKADITEWKQMREMLLQSEKLKTLGVMTYGISHEFSNILAVISGSVQLLKESYKDSVPPRCDEELMDKLGIIRESTDNGAEIIRMMNEYIKVKEDDPSGFIDLDIRDLIKQAIDFTLPKWKNMAQAKGITYHIDREGLKKVPALPGNPLELREVLVNIMNNALDAMPDGGRISFHTVKKEETIFISISDTGEGMSEDVQKQIFDPFFTTRRPKGTGLGMSVAYGIITRHGGNIDVESEVGKGSTFTIRLPIKKGTASSKVSTKTTKRKNLKKLNILVVGDEENICMVLDKFLSGEGHKVEVVNDGVEAIKLLKSEGFDLVLCDLAMPDIFGYEVIKALNELDKRPKVGVINGWTEAKEITRGEDLKVDFVVRKPFELSEIRRNIRNIFGAG